MIFELVVTLCLGEICQPRVVPNPAGAQTEASCQRTAQSRAQAWASGFPNATTPGITCTAIEALSDRAATVIETSPGHFVHFGKVESVSEGSDGDVANTGFIIGQRSVAVIDSGTTRANAEALYLALRQQTDLPVSALILTHMHPDHVLGASVFRDAGALVISSAKMPRALAQRAAGYMAGMERLIGLHQIHGTVPAYPDVTLSAEMTLDLGDRVLDLRAYPTAHTDNDLTVLDRATATMWMGDLVFLEHTPALDGSINGWIDALTGLAALPVEHMVPGHGRMVSAFPEGAAPTLEYLTSIRRQTREALEKGESLSQAVRHIGLDHAKDWQMFEEFNPRNATSAYVELEWE
ncbi:MAG: quinoprotein relay system zinc metallohydrolase 2 [Sulfitobacter sp.]|jgi:quinoprotein relay system zinc metallohydrolase 2|nr:quinoprotein relay system zinc metallohydrolase 2 [Sulfitobacter sp.]